MDELDLIWAKTLDDSALVARPSFRFDPVFYAQVYPELSGTVQELERHYQQHGKREGRFPNAFRRLRATNPRAGHRIRRLIVDGRIRRALAQNRLEATELAFELIRAGHGAAISNFSGKHYLDRNPDVALAEVDPLEHYVVHGHREKRATLESVRSAQHTGTLSYRPELPTCLIAVHELSNTGAPRVGLDLAREAAQTHNVIVAALRGGPLLDDMRRTACEVIVTNRPHDDFGYFRGEIFGRVDVAVCNSVETYPFVPLLVGREIPFAAYVHEYTWYTFPTYKSIHIALFADLLLFSSEHVQESWRSVLDDIEMDVDRDVGIIPQRTLSVGTVDTDTFQRARARLSSMIGADCTDKRIVCGAGHAQWRKGTDLFVTTAQIARHRDADTLFVWVGDGISFEDTHFGAWMTHHLVQAEANALDGNLFVLPAGDHYPDVLAAADAMLLSSRLDPLPNVVFDAAEAGCAIVLFDGASGFTDSRYDNADQFCVVEYANPDAAAAALLELPRKSPLETTGQPAPQAPLFTAIIDRLEQVRRARRRFVVGGTEYDVPVLYSSAADDFCNRVREREKLFTSRRRILWRSPDEARRVLAESKSWVHRSCEVVRYAEVPVNDLPPFSVHLHAFYVGGLKKEFEAFLAYKLASRVVVTTDTDDKKSKIESMLKKAQISGEVVVVDNRGRDILPFMDLFRSPGFTADDEVWGHFHQKRSLTSTSGGDVWRSFLTSILLGTGESMSAAPSLAADGDTGLVAALDPFYGQWNASRKFLPRMNRSLTATLPNNPMVYPMGNMFWVKGGVVREMNALFPDGYPWPNEPIPNDGTEFHLIERLWPAVAAQCGMRSVFVSKPEQPRRV